MIFVRGLGAPETPRLLPADKSWVCVEMAPPRSGVTHISRDGKAVSLVTRTGLPQGLAPHANGDIWVLNNDPGAALMRVTLSGESEVVVEDIGGLAMLLVNDLCFGPDGHLYMTDSGMTMADWVVAGDVRPDYQTAPFDGRVYQIDLATRTGRVIDRGIRFTNGIAFGPDDHLYVNEMISGDIFRYRFHDGVPGSTRTLRQRHERGLGGWLPRSRWHGLRCGWRLYCTVFGEADITVIDADGSVVQRHPDRGPAAHQRGLGARRRQTALRDRTAAGSHRAASRPTRPRCRCTTAAPSASASRASHGHHAYLRTTPAVPLSHV